LRILEVVFEREYAPLVLLDHDSILQQYQQLRDSKGLFFVEIFLIIYTIY